MISRKYRWDNDDFYTVKYKCFHKGGDGGGGEATSTSSSSSSSYGFPEPKYPGPSESELALAEIATEKYASWEKTYKPVENEFLADQNENKSGYGKMMAYADAGQATQGPDQLNVAHGAGGMALGAMANTRTQAASAGAATAESADFQRRKSNKLTALSMANKLQASNQSSLAGVANAASSSAIQVAQNKQGMDNRLVQQAAQNQHAMQMQEYNYNQGKIQNLAQMGASIYGWKSGQLGNPSTSGGWGQSAGQQPNYGGPVSSWGNWSQGYT